MDAPTDGPLLIPIILNKNFTPVCSSIVFVFLLSIKAIELAKKYSFHEHLYRCYMNLYDIYLKRDEYTDARHAAEEAAKAGKGLSNLTFEGDARIREAKVL